jgi:acetate kinase
MDKPHVLAINSGSSSIKFSLFNMEDKLNILFSGEMENIGSQETRLHYTKGLRNEKGKIDLGLKTFEEGAGYLVDFIFENIEINKVLAIGHRIVQGLHYSEPEILNPKIIDYLKSLIPYDPDHLPGEIRLIELFSQKFLEGTQIACFDTSFHTHIPKQAQLFGIPRKFFDKGIKRYGFHGISYTYLMHELNILIGNKAQNSRIILAHLGSGASLAAIKNGHCQDTSMGFTPNSGLVMGTRTGDLEPGLMTYLSREEKISMESLNTLFNKESGLLGISQTSSDMRELKKIQAKDYRAQEAINLFEYQVKKWIGAYSAVLNGLDILVFAGGIGENDRECRENICQGLDYLGLRLDRAKNSQNEAIISSTESLVSVRVIPTREEWMIAHLVCDKLNIPILGI